MRTPESDVVGANRPNFGILSAHDFPMSDPMRLEVSNPGSDGESNTIRIGTQGRQTATFVAGIWLTPIPGPKRLVTVK